MTGCEMGRVNRRFAGPAAGPILSAALSAIALILAAHPGIASAADAQAEAAARQFVADALRAEVKGDSTSRQTLLNEAVRTAPDNRLAHWQEGQVELANRWMPVEKAEQLAAADPRLAEYLRLRASASDNLDSQLTLARWCRKHQLVDEAQVHWTNVLSHDPNNEEALRALGKRWYSGRLMTYAEVDAAKERVRAARAAAKRFAPQVAKWERLLSAGDLESREQALDEIRAVSEADAIPALEEVTLKARQSGDRKLEHLTPVGLAFVAALDAMPAQAATESLVRHAVFSKSPEVRAAASEALKQRPPHDFVPMLLDSLTMPIESSYRITTDADGAVNYWHSLYQVGATEDKSSDTLRGDWQNFSPASPNPNSDEDLAPTSADLVRAARIAQRRVFNAAQYQRKFVKQAAAVEQDVAKQNQAGETLNEKIVPVLAYVTGEDYGAEPQQWWDWWQRYNESYSPYERPVRERSTTDISHHYFSEPRTEIHSCFPRGTLVWTKTGKRAIEKIEIGDLVLAESANTGELAYKAVVGRTLRPSRPMLNISLGDEMLVVTKGHPFWVDGVGWRMAKELEEGAILHGVHGPVRVTRVEPAEEFDAYNLAVADFNTYFVGNAGVLVHDITPRQPTLATVPGVTTK